MGSLMGMLTSHDPDLPVTYQDLETVPTGHETEIANSYYHWLYGNYFVRWREPWLLTFDEEFMQIMVVSAWMIGFFWIFAFHFDQVHRSKKDLYKPTIYSGQVTERHGKFGPFSIVITVGITLWAFYYAYSHVALGYIY